MPRLDPGGLSGAFKRTRRARSLDFLVPDKTEEAGSQAQPEVTPAKPEAKAPAKPKAKKAPAKKKAAPKPKAKKAPARKAPAKKKAAPKSKAKKAPAKKKPAAKAKPKAQAEPKSKVAAQAPAERKFATPRPLGRPLVRKAPGTPAWPAERGVRAWATRRAERLVARLLRLAA